MPEMTPTAHSGWLQNAVEILQKSAENGSEMQKNAYKSEMVWDTARDKCTAESEASSNSSNFSSEEYQQSFRIKWHAFCLAHLMVGVLFKQNAMVLT